MDSGLLSERGEVDYVARQAVDLEEDDDVDLTPQPADAGEARPAEAEPLVAAGDVEVPDDLDDLPALCLGVVSAGVLLDLRGHRGVVRSPVT